ncbi:MAG: tetratricopeptide repeat protein [Phycisphaerales bacterium]|nr:tetratricopeptide repeat protein [Phycisphaerales bacterium]
MNRIIAVLWLALACAGVLFCQSCEDRSPVPEQLEPSSSQESIRHSLEAAEIYIASGNTDKAQAILARLIDQSPDDPRPYEVMARLALRKGLQLRDMGLIEASRDQFGTSYDLYKDAVSRMPESSGLHQSAGEVAQQAGQHEEALACYLRSIELDPGNMRSQINAAQLLIETSPERSEAMLRSVLETDSEQPHALSSLALLLQRAGRESESSEMASRALAVAGDQEGVRIAVARIHLEANRPRVALELLLALSDQVRGQEPATSQIAIAWESLGNSINAGQAWSECFRTNAHRTDAWRFALRAAEAFGRAGQEAMAASWLEQAIMLDAPAMEIEEARRSIRMGTGPD